jgi:transcriptional regulator with XRE-family HTH domain
MYEKINIIVGSILKESRKKLNLTLEEVSSRFGKTKGWLSDIERGRNRIYYDDMLGLCEIYNLDINDIARIIKENK